MGFVALGGLAAVLISMPPVAEAWSAGGLGILGLWCWGLRPSWRRGAGANSMAPGAVRASALLAVLIGRVLRLSRGVRPGGCGGRGGQPGRDGLSGRAGLPVETELADRLARGRPCWPPVRPGSSARRRLACARTTLAIATLGIAEIIIAIMKNEDWLSARREERGRPAAPGALRDRLAEPRGLCGARPGSGLIR